MLSLMRKHAQSWLIKFALGAIIVVFIFWYGWNYRAQRGNRIAVVNDSPIVLDEFRSVYEQLVEGYRRQFGNAFDEKLVESLNLKRQALDQLINHTLLLQESTRLKFRVTNEELLRAIQQVPAFQRNGRFHPQVYQRVLRRNRMTPEMYEEIKKSELLINKLQSFFLESIKVSEAEALETYKWLKEEVSLDYVVFKPSAHGNVEVTPEEVETYFAKHKKTYETPPELKVQYLLLDFNEFEAQAKVSEEEVSSYFEINKDDYSTPKKVRARHILFKVRSDAKPEEIEEARQKALNVLKEARSGKDFGKLAKEYSDDPGSRGKGGDLGFFSKDSMVKPFSDVAFAMKPGEISEPVRTSFGWHIIKVDVVQEAKEPALAEVADEIRSKLLKDAARTLAFDRAEEIYEACYGAGNISDVAKANHLKVHETGFFSSNGPIKGIKEEKKFAEMAFALGENEVSEPLELSQGYYIVEPIAKKPARIPDLKTLEERVRQDLIQAKEDDLAKQDAEGFLSSLKGGAEFQKAAANKKLKSKSTGLFKRSGAIPEIGLEQEIQRAAFLLSASNPFPDGVIKGRQGYYVIRFKARQEADPKEFEDQKSRITSSLLRQKRQRAIGGLLAQLREKSEITVEEGFLD
jgi:peptidyl-prolyl cis-trans isomerase D